MTEIEWLNNNELSLDIWNKKYRYNNETFDQWLDRVSGGNKELKQLIIDKKFLFGGRILANRGIAIKGKTYSNCYVIPPVEDSIEGIYDTCRQLARTFSYGGGCGVDISKLRPKGAKVNNSAQTTTGAVSFMQTLSQVSETIGQNGRRGATMISIDVRHPDVPDFISIKNDLTKVTGANISIRVNNEFMRAVQEDKDYLLHWPCDAAGTFNFEVDAPYGQLMETTSINGNIVYYKRIKAKELFHTLCENNWDYAEPGILYWDTIREYNMMSSDPNFEYAGVNPCA